MSSDSHTTDSINEAIHVCCAVDVIETLGLSRVIKPFIGTTALETSRQHRRKIGISFKLIGPFYGLRNEKTGPYSALKKAKAIL